MGKSKKGGVYGYLRGRVGSVSYSILNASRSKSGKKEQIVRALPDLVANPQTAGQVMQRMKLAPAQKFYNAFSELLSNAFEGVEYGEASRRYFMSLAMAQDGPYVKRGVDRFIPAQYPFSRGSIPAVGIQEFEGGAANTVITLAVTTEEATVDNALLASLLGVTTDYQITIAVVNNINGVFVPSYIGFDDRLKISEIPAGALSKDAENHVTISPAAFGLDASNMVAQVVVLSVQDASGNWLRSEQDMVISNQLIEALYGTSALEAAIYSYQTSNGAQNAINSQWYYNLGLAQAFAGKLTTTYLAADVDESHGYGTRTGIVGVKQLNGVIKYTIFTETADAGAAVMIVKNGEIVPWVQDGDTITAAMIVEPANVDVEVWQPAYAQQLGYMQGGSSTPTPAVEIFTDAACTTKPIAGTAYTKLYARCNRAFGLNEAKSWGADGSDGEKLQISTPSTEEPTEEYAVILYNYAFEGDLTTAITAGQVVECNASTSSPTSVQSPMVTAFFDE